MKKLLSFLLSLSLAFCMIGINVSAAEVARPGTDKVYTFSVQDTSAELRGKLADTGIVLKDNTELQLVPLETTGTRSAGSALIVINQAGEKAVKDVIIPVEDDVVGFNLSDSITSGNYTDDSITLGWDAKILIRGTANYDKYVPSSGGRTYYRPRSASFRYTYKEPSDDTTVYFLEMNYSCSGPVFAYPGFADQGYTYEKVIRVYQSLPVASRTYSNSDPLSNELVISPSYGVMNGHYMTFNANINGRDDGITVPIYD